ncbi:MAG: DUF484 family protein [Paracoccus sp. (in: a-proteobacteria)]|uniref:DUF484 family protein n=1 Tax=Paracoccus sp. TaxID=267 RepID=UPI002E867BBE|nr:DUF484 family protein [Pseudomonadota bacterium]
MSDTGLDPVMRERLLADPAAILGDRDLMRALVSAREAELGANVIDIRGRAMEALEHRLDRLEATHESVIAAAFDNQSGMAMVHRAVLGLLESADLAEFAASLQSDIAPLLRIETLRLIVEEAPPPGLPEDVIVAPEGLIERIVAAGRRAPRGTDIVLRPAMVVTRPLHGRSVGSEALLPLDLGGGRPRALLLMGSVEATRFMPAHGTDLLRFFAQVFRLVLLERLRG